jgi:hypothetical protein
MAAPQQIVFEDPREPNIHLRNLQEAWVIMKRKADLAPDLALDLPLQEDHPLYGLQVLLNGQQGNIPIIYFHRAWNVLNGLPVNAFVPGFPRVWRRGHELDLLESLHAASLDAPILPHHPVAANAVEPNEPFALNSNNMELNGGGRRKNRRNTRKANRKNRKSRKYNKRR